MATTVGASQKPAQGVTATPAKPAAPKLTKEQRAAEKASAFRRLANKRMPVALKRIELIGNLAAYPHNEAQAKAIITALDQAVEAVERQFVGTAEEGVSFKLPE